MLVNFQFSSVIAGENVHHMNAKNDDEAWEKLRHIAPRGSAEAWRDLFQKLNDNQHRMAIVDYAISPAVVKRYLQEIVGVPKDILDKVIIEACDKRPANMNELISHVQEKSGNDNLARDRIWLVSDRRDYIVPAQREGISPFLVSEVPNDISFMKPLTIAITNKQVELLLPEPKIDMSLYISGEGTPYTNLATSKDVFSSSGSLSLSGSRELNLNTRPESMKPNLFHSGEVASVKVDKSDRQRLQNAYEKTMQLKSAGFFGGRVDYDYQDLRKQILLLVGNVETRVQPYEALLENIKAANLSDQRKVNLYAELVKYLSAPTVDAKLKPVLERTQDCMNDLMQNRPRI